MSLDPAIANDAATQWYGCECDLGRIHVGVVVGEQMLANMSGPLKVIRQAALLAGVELTLQAIELWQSIDLDLEPADEAPAVEQTIELQIAHKEMTDYPPVRLQLPGSAITRLKPVDAELIRSLRLSWSTLNATLVLGDVAVSEDEHRNLEQGAVVLLPQSYESQWRSRLRVQEVPDASIDGILSIDPARFVTTGPVTTAGNPQADGLSIQLQQQISITPDLLLGEGAGVTIMLDLQTSPLAASLLQGNNIIATGSLGSVGAGHAFYVHSMSVHDQQGTL